MLERGVGGLAEEVVMRTHEGSSRRDRHASSRYDELLWSLYVATVSGGTLVWAVTYAAGADPLPMAWLRGADTLAMVALARVARRLRGAAPRCDVHCGLFDAPARCDDCAAALRWRVPSLALVEVLRAGGGPDAP